jgi:hypothetical protein
MLKSSTRLNCKESLYMTLEEKKNVNLTYQDRETTGIPS